MKQKLKEWGLLCFIKTLQKQFPDFSTRNKLLSQIASAFPDNIKLYDGVAHVTREREESGRDVPPEIIEKEVTLFCWIYSYSVYIHNIMYMARCVYTIYTASIINPLVEHMHSSSLLIYHCLLQLFRLNMQTKCLNMEMNRI